MIRAQTRGYKVVDEISQVLGDERYMENYYPPGLKARTVGEHSLELVSVTRYYLLLEPRVVVDFEPSPLDGKFWLDEKRQWMYEQGIIYVPIMLGDRLTMAEFKSRLDDERAFLLGEHRAIKDSQFLASVDIQSVLQNLPPDRTVEDVMLHPATVRWIDEETKRRFDVQHGGRKELRGAARNVVLAQIKRTVIEDVRERVKHGRMGRDLRDQHAQVAAR